MEPETGRWDVGVDANPDADVIVHDQQVTDRAVMRTIDVVPDTEPDLHDSDPEALTREQLLELVRRLRYERRLLGVARMTLDLVNACGDDRLPAARVEAGEIAQRIVDEIGHPVTDEPALGPHYRDTLADILGRADDPDEGLHHRLHDIRALCRAALQL